MRLPIDGLSKHLPHWFPVGATYVIEGYGGEGGNLRVISRYVVLPGGLRINVPAEISQPAGRAASSHSGEALTPSNLGPKAAPGGNGKNSPAIPELDGGINVD